VITCYGPKVQIKYYYNLGEGVVVVEGVDMSVLLHIPPIWEHLPLRNVQTHPVSKRSSGN